MAAVRRASSTGRLENMVPHYDLYGSQHPRDPFKEKPDFVPDDLRGHPWLQPPPPVRSRAELIQARQSSRLPGPSYDFDGDGVVGQLDHFIGRSFDKDNDGRLTKAERRQARRALEDGFLDRYVRGLDSTGAPSRKDRMRQVRGVIVTEDSPGAGSSYPPHHNADVIPPNQTRTALAISRKADLKCAAAVFGERHAVECAPVDERMPPDHRSRPRECPVERISQRAAADNQASRARAGLLPTGTPVNPEREMKTVGMEYVERPFMATRNQIIETRKEANRAQLEAQRLKGEETFVEMEVQKSIKAAKEFEFRRPETVPMTLTELQARRKKDRIEHDMEHFPLPRVGPREYPRFSDNPEVPFWLADQAGGASSSLRQAPEVPAAASSSSGGRARGPALSRTLSEPTMKVTQVPFKHAVSRPETGDMPAAAHATQAAAGRAAGAPYEIGSHIVKRWTSDVLDRGAGLNKPRLFDSIPIASVGPKDLQTLDFTSSLEPVRREAYRRMAEDHRHSAKRSAMYADTSAEYAGMFDMDPTLVGNRGSLGPRIPVIRPATAKANLFDLDAGGSPRFFGSSAHIQRPTTQTGVRTGGFAAFDQLTQN